MVLQGERVVLIRENETKEGSTESGKTRENGRGRLDGGSTGRSRVKGDKHTGKEKLYIHARYLSAKSAFCIVLQVTSRVPVMGNE